jgi:predicted XRE-type DNA-binding protein
MNMKAHLATALGQIIEQRGWTSPQAASLLGLPDAQLSNILTGNFRTEDAASLVHYIARLGYNVQITIAKAAQPTGSGCVEVVSAPPR